MEWKIGDITIPNQVVVAPMAGVTNVAFRMICKEFGAGMVVCEMISDKGIHFRNKKTLEMLFVDPSEHPASVQIFGGSKETLVEAAQFVAENTNTDIIDINMGCPMPKIANSGDGCGLMRTPELAGDIVAAVKKAVDVPVTVKCRLGWDKGNLNVLDFTKRMEDNGADMITVHGRTRAMLYSGVADWDMITKVKQQLSIPVIANGDIVDGKTAYDCRRRTGADGIMIGRATFGDPWIFAQARAALAGEELPQRPPLAKRVDLAVRQFELARDDKGEHIACLEARKHFAWYLRGVSHSSYYNCLLYTSPSPRDCS